MRKVACLLSLALISSVVHAADFSIGLSNEAAAVDFTSEAIGNGLSFTAGGLHHTDHGNLLGAGLQVSQQIDRNVTASVGAKWVGVFNDTKNATALALGGAIDVALPAQPKVHLGAHAWYAPTVTSSNGTKSFQDVGVSAGYRILSNAEVYAAYRYVRVDYESKKDLTIYDGPTLGMKLFF